MALAAALSAVCGLAQADPLSSNNGFYPTDNYRGRFITSNLDYPDAPQGARFPAGGPSGAALTVETAEEYMMALKTFIGQKFSVIINNPEEWDPVDAGWYDLVWSGNSDQHPKDPTSGREALMNTYTGQIIHNTSFKEAHRPTSEYVQNHAVIYYDERSAAMLGNVWEDLYDAEISKLSFPEGSIVIKTEATTPTIAEWPSVLDKAATWRVFRPTTKAQAELPEGVDKSTLVPVVVEAHPLQMSIKVKDSVASPETGWVFMAFVYDAKSTGESKWARFVPLGAMWGNDPEFNRDPNGRPAGKP